LNNFHNCSVGGVELNIATYGSATNSWSWPTPIRVAVEGCP
jgi:hypothetical protein